MELIDAFRITLQAYDTILKPFIPRWMYVNYSSNLNFLVRTPDREKFNYAYISIGNVKQKKRTEYRISVQKFVQFAEITNRRPTIEAYMSLFWEMLRDMYLCPQTYEEYNEITGIRRTENEQDN